MALSVQVDTKKPLRVAPEDGEQTIVKNIGTEPVFYKAGQFGESVSSSNKDGELTNGQSLTLTQTEFFLAKAVPAQVEIAATFRAAGGQLNALGVGYVNAGEAPYYAGISTNAAKSINEALVAGKEGVVYIPPGFYKITEPIVVPQLTTLMGGNPRTTVLEVEGNISLLQLGKGDITISGIGLSSVAKQSAGNAIDFTKGFVSKAHIFNMIIGSRFFNGMNIVGETEASLVNVHDVDFQDLAGGGVKEYGGTPIIIGGTGSEAVHRAYNTWLRGILIQGATATDIKQCIEMNNSDSTQINTVLMQTAEKGCIIGNNDSSSKATTNLQTSNFQADGCSVAGFEIAKCFNATLSCRAEAGGVGLVLGGEASGNTISGSTFYFNSSHGIEVKNTVSAAYENTINGCTITNNGQAKAAGASGIFIADKSGSAVGGLQITGNTIGNSPIGLGAEEQKVGITLGKECENIGISGNRFAANKTSAFKQNTGEVKINNETIEAKIKESIEKTNQLT